MTWREFRSSTPQQSEFLDALTLQGAYYDKDVLRRPRLPNDPELGILRPMGLYGGAGYGGKSYGLRTATGELNGYFRSIGLPNRWGCLMCKRYTELANRQVRKLETEFREIGRVKTSKIHGLLFEFFEPGMGGFFLRNAQDPEGMKGAEYDWLLIDELTQFSRSEFDDAYYLLRSPVMPFLPFGAATNPDGIGHAWVKRWWVDRDFEDDQQLIADGVLNPDAYYFVKARAQDNPTFSRAVEAQLRGFDDEALVLARWEGSWEIGGGLRFGRYSKALHSFTDEDFMDEYGWLDSSATEPIDLIRNPDFFEVYGSLDYGTDENAASAFYLHAVSYEDPSYVWTFDEHYMQGYWLDQQAETIKRACAPFGDVKVYVDPSLKGRDSEGISRMAKFRDAGVRAVPGINDRMEGWATLDQFLSYEQGDDGAMRRPPRWRVTYRARHLHRQLASAPRDTLKMEDVAKSFKDDHGIDSVRYFLHSHFRGATRPKERPAPMSGAWLREQTKRERRADDKAGFW